MTALRKDGYFCTYFHPWEFYDLKSLQQEGIKLPGMICRNSGEGMRERLDGLIKYFKARGKEFNTIFDLYTKSLDRLYKKQG